MCSVFVLYEIKIENKQKKKKNFFFSNWEFFVWNWEKNILFGIGNGAEFRPQNRVIESPGGGDILFSACSPVPSFITHCRIYSKSGA